MGSRLNRVGQARIDIIQACNAFTSLCLTMCPFPDDTVLVQYRAKAALGGILDGGEGWTM